jgi:hypothetical protein
MKNLPCLIVMIIPIVLGCGSGNKAVVETIPDIPKIENYLGEPKRSSIDYLENADAFVPFPFHLITYTSDHHIIAFFDGHDVYESVEAFIFPEDDRGLPIHAILTRHDNSQVDYINRESMLSPIRDSHTADIDFDYRDRGKAAMLSFADERGNAWKLIYLADYAVSSEWGGLIDVGGHSPDSSMPLFCYDEAGIASEGSYVSENGKKYAIALDRQASKPPFFIAYRAYVSKGYNAAIFLAGEACERLERFSVKDGTDKAAYFNDGVTQTAELEWKGPVPEVRSITASSGIYSPDRSVTVRFNPPLPNFHAMAPGTECLVRFDISFDTTEDLVYGTIRVNKQDNETVEMEMQPAYPAWAARTRRMLYRLTEESDQLKSSIVVRHGRQQ